MANINKGLFGSAVTWLLTANPLAAFSVWAATNYLFDSNKRDNSDSQTYGDREPDTLVNQDKPVPIVYGRCKVGGSLVRINAASETQAKWIVAYCEGAVYSATQLYINDIAFGDLDSVKSSESSVTFYYGTYTQDPEWPAWSRVSSFKGLCHHAMVLKKDEQISGRPSITMIIDGRLCVSPDLNNGASGIVESGTYKWTASGSGTNEYYCEADGGGDPGLDEPDGILFDTIPWAKKTVGEFLSGYGSWDYGDNDTLGYDTIYVRLIDDADPDTKDDGFIQCTKYSRNPGTILYDYLNKIEGWADSELDLTEFGTLITYCDAVPDGGTLPRYRFDFVIDAEMSHADVKKLMCSSFHGSLCWSQGKLKPVWEKARDSSHTFSTDNIVKGSISWGQPEKINLVRIKFRDLSDNKMKTHIAEVSDRLDISENGEYIFEQTCDFITDPEIARRRAQLIFDKYKYTDALGLLTGLPDSSDVELFNRTQVTHSSPGWNAKDFIIKSKSCDEHGRNTFELEAYYAGMYGDDEAQTQTGYADELPDAFAQLGDCTSLSATENEYINTDGEYNPSVNLTYTRPGDHIFWGWGEIQIATDGSTFRYYGKDMSEGVGFTIDAAKGNFKVGDTLTVKVISVSQDGIRGVASTSPTTTVTVTGVSVAPDTPTGLELYGASDAAAHVWKGTRFSLKWRGASQTGGFARETFGSELQGFGGSGEDPYWKYDEMELWTDGVRRGFWTSKALCFEYIFGDYQDRHLDNYIVAANGTVTFRVRRWNNFNKVSDWASIIITHNSPDMTLPTVVFTGKDCEIDWDPVTSAFKKYVVLVYSDSSRSDLIRTEYTQDAHYSYTFEKNYVDNSGTPIRTVYFTVSVYNVFDQTDSENCSGANATPTTPSAPTITAEYSSLIISWDEVAHLDIIGYNIYVDDSSPASTLRGFTDGTTFIYTGDPATLYYVKISAVDKYGESTLSSEANATTLSLPMTSYDLDVPLTSGIDWSTDSKAKWTTGTLVYEGVAYTIAAGETTDAYIYWDKDDAPTTFLHAAAQPTLTDDVYLMAYYDSTGDVVYPAKGYKIVHAGLIQAASITAAEIAASTITAAKMDVTELSAIAANLGTITAGTITGALIQTAATGQRIAISNVDNTLRFDTAANTDVIVIDDSIYGSTPGIKIIDGVINLYTDASNQSFLYPNYLTVTQDTHLYSAVFENKYVSAVGGHGVVADASTAKASAHGAERFGLWAISAITNVANNDIAYGVYAQASTTGGGSAYSGHFTGGDFYIKLGDNAGANKVYIYDSDDVEMVTMNSNGAVGMKSAVIGAAFIGAGANYASFAADGTITFAGTAEFHLPRVSQSAQPTPTVGELQVWRDPDDNKTYLIYNDTDEGVRKVEMT